MAVMNMPDLDILRELVFDGDNDACFIERERILDRLEGEMKEYAEPDKYARIFAALLSEVSVPIHEGDYFAGRIVEAVRTDGARGWNGLLMSNGHFSPDYRTVLKRGLSGMLDEIKSTADKKGDKESASFARNAEIVITAVKAYAERYAAAARDMGRNEMADALERVPFEPAYDYYSALQSIWLIHMIAGGYVGARDFAFGRFDEYMLPYYKKALDDGKTEEELTELLAGFMMKCNEICGRTTHNHRSKPVPCQASKQYINIGGENPNEFSCVVLKAAMLCNMAQPQITVLLKPDADAHFTDEVFAALSYLVDKLHIYNYDLVLEGLLKKGIPDDIARDFTYSACCTFDLNYHTDRQEHYVPVPQIFVEMLHKKDYSSLDELIGEFRNGLHENMRQYTEAVYRGKNIDTLRRQYVLDSILLWDSGREARYHFDGRAHYTVMNLFCPGVATIGDSLMTLDRLVFKEKRFGYAEFAEILKNNFVGHEELRAEILAQTRFGNDTDADDYTALAGNIFCDAVDMLELKPGYYAIAGFYTLERENTVKNDVGATPDGKLAGEPFSENQSPVYGADKNGITALLKSAAKLPFVRTAAGGLNLTFSASQAPQTLKALTLAYFAVGGFHIGISVIDREVLCDAMVNPDRYKSLTVRLYGFSEYFVSLPDWQQIAILNRTAY